jgi:hypothetical protein
VADLGDPQKLLRAQHERPSSRRAAENSNKLAAFHCPCLLPVRKKSTGPVRHEPAALRDFVWHMTAWVKT